MCIIKLLSWLHRTALAERCTGSSPVCSTFINSMSLHNPQYQEEFEVEVLDSSRYMLIVWNDDVNTFDWVIKTLIEVCKHEPEQAEQCAMLIHYKGKTDVKRGSFEELKTMCEAIIDRGIGATVEEIKA